MKGANSGHMEVDEKEWRSMLEVALEAGKFTEYQNRNFQDWLKHNFTTIKNSKVRKGTINLLSHFTAP